MIFSDIPAMAPELQESGFSSWGITGFLSASEWQRKAGQDTGADDFHDVLLVSPQGTEGGNGNDRKQPPEGAGGC
jgi:hypothetical protein